MLRAGLLLLALLFTSGCSTTGGGLITSLEDLSTESVKEGWIKVPQYRVVSIPGWLPFADVGGLYFYKARRKPASAIGLSPGKSFELTSEITGGCDLDCLVEMRAGIVALTALAQDVVETKIALTELQAARETVSTALAEAKSSHDQVRNAFNIKYEAVIASLKDAGVLVYRWSTTNKASGSGLFGSLFSGSAKSEHSYNGFALISGIRSRTLFAGQDFLTGWLDLDRKSRYHNRFEVTTHVMQAQHVVYGATMDLNQIAQAKLRASYEQLKGLPETWKSLEVEVQATLARVANLSNMGVMGNITRTISDVQWSVEAQQSRFADDGWSTFYSVSSDFGDLSELLKKNK